MLSDIASDIEFQTDMPSRRDSAAQSESRETRCAQSHQASFESDMRVLNK
jgi:hypothetical protein